MSLGCSLVEVSPNCFTFNAAGASETSAASFAMSGYCGSVCLESGSRGLRLSNSWLTTDPPETPIYPNQPQALQPTTNDKVRRFFTQALKLRTLPVAEAVESCRFIVMSSAPTSHAQTDSRPCLQVVPVSFLAFKFSV